MLKKEFLLVWMISSLTMLGMSYVWHGIILNDYRFIKLPFISFILLQGIVYAVIGFVLTFVYHYTNINRKVKYKGFMMGAVLGFFIYLIAYVLGISFKTGEFNYVIVVDFLWQMGEQALGGGVVGFAFVVLERVEKLADVS
ncbi:MAG: hypothetical protein ACI8XB_000791 [Patiriisocius sp.]|jgi:hypothetical protein